MLLIDLQALLVITSVFSKASPRLTSEWMGRSVTEQLVGNPGVWRPEAQSKPELEPPRGMPPTETQGAGTIWLRELVGVQLLSTCF